MVAKDTRQQTAQVDPLLMFLTTEAESDTPASEFDTLAGDLFLWLSTVALPLGLTSLFQSLKDVVRL